MQGDKKPVVMTEDIDQSVAKKLHASQHAAGGSDPITPAAIGAINSEAVYWGSASQKSADDLTDPLALIVCTDSLNSELYYKIGSMAYVMTAGSGENKFQVAWPYYARSGMATRSCKSGTWSKWADFATTDYAVNKAGDMTTGVFSNQNEGIQSDLASFASGLLFRAYQIDDWDGRRSLILGTRQATSLANALTLGVLDTGKWVDYPVLHTGNKPSGSYTGNGDGTSRTIDIGGIGNALLIRGNGVSSIVTSDGAFILMNDSVSALSSAYVKFVNGVLTLATNHGGLNASGVTYTYQVL